MRTVICHFRNEEYLLPFWLRHHREIFDHGVMIDYHSTDRSREIIRELAPDWEIITSEYKKWDAIECTFECMRHEHRFQGWKMILNVTEFLCTPDLAAMERRVEAKGALGIYARGVIMVDPPGNEKIPLNSSRSLVGQRSFGYFEDEKSWARLWRRIGIHVRPGYIPGRPTYMHTWPVPFLYRKARGLLRSRLYHCAGHGAYAGGGGRHESQWGAACLGPGNDFLVLWFCYSPWNESMANRLMCKGDIEISRQGARSGHMQRLNNRARIDTYRNRFLYRKSVRDLSRDPVFTAATAHWQVK